MTLTDDESMPTIRCPSCSKWHHRSCLMTSGLQGGLCSRRFRDFNDVMENSAVSASLTALPSVPTINYRWQVLKIHYAEFARYLAHTVSYPNFRSTARSKLIRIKNGPLFELSTDVYEELMRRNYQNEGTSCKPDMIPVLVMLFSPSPISSRHRRISSRTKSSTPKHGNTTYNSF